MKNLFRASLLVLSVALLGSLSACKECKELKTDVLQPASAASALLATLKTDADVAKACPALLDTLKNTSEGAADVRDMAADKFTETHSNCIRWITAIRWERRCFSNGFIMECRNYPVSYEYCAAYDTHTSHDPGYDTAMSLSADLETMFDKANTMCASPNGTDASDATLAASQDLSSYISSTITPESDQVYGLACN